MLNSRSEEAERRGARRQNKRRTSISSILNSSIHPSCSPLTRLQLNWIGSDSVILNTEFSDVEYFLEQKDNKWAAKRVACDLVEYFIRINEGYAIEHSQRRKSKGVKIKYNEIMESEHRKERTKVSATKRYKYTMQFLVSLYQHSNQQNMYSAKSVVELVLVVFFSNFSCSLNAKSWYSKLHKYATFLKYQV